MITIDFDIYYESVRPTSTEHVKVTLLAEEGPGGGNPWYAFTGTTEHLREYLLNYNQQTCELSPSELEELTNEQLSHISHQSVLNKLK